MRKHFLILMLLTLLPFTAWAVDIVVTPGSISKTYGADDPDNEGKAVTAMFLMEGTDAANKNAVASHLLYSRIQNGEDAGYSYSYSLAWDGTQVDGKDIIVTGNGTLNIIAKDIAIVDDPAIAEQTFHVGNWNAPTFNLAGLTLGTDYTIEGYTNSADGEITGKGDGNKVTVKGIGNYKGTATYNFNIAALTVGEGDAPIASIAGVFDNYDYTYDGTAKEIPAYTIKETVGEDQVDIKESFEFTEPDELTNAGDKEIIATAKDESNYTGSFKFHFTIQGKSIEGLTFDNVPNVTYRGTAFEPTPTVTDEVLDYELTNEGVSPDVTYAYEDNINAGMAKVTVTGHNNYTGSKVIEFNIAKRDLEDINITPIAAAAYTGVAQTPDVTAAHTDAILDDGKLPVVYNEDTETGDFNVAYANNTNASTDAQKAKATITAVANSNYTGSKEVEFTINKAEVTVTPKAYRRALNEENPTSDYLVENEYYEFSDFQNGETTITANVTGAPSFTIVFDPENDNTVGDHAGVIKINRAEGIVTGLSAANYKFVPGADATLTITGANNFTIAFNNDIKVTYGDNTNLAKIYGNNNVNAKDYLDVTGLGDDVIKSMTITVVDENGEAVDPATVKNVGTYYLKADPTSIKLNVAANEANYAFADVEIANGSFQIIKRDIAFKAVNQTLTYGEEPILTTGADRIELVDGSYAEGDGRSDMNLTLTVAPSYTGAVGEHTGVLILGASNDNYKFTLTDGNIKVVAGTGIALGEGDDDLQLISDYAGQPVNVTINFAATRNGRDLGGERNWVKENWVTLTLPFNITVAELSQKLGYAIVNEIDPSKTKIDGTGSEFYGKLTMKGAYGEEYLPANKPFLVKIADDIVNRNGGVINFGEQSIVAPTDLTVDAGKGAKFVGTYSPKTVGKGTEFNDGSIWFMIGGGYTKWAFINAGSTKADWTIAPFEAYIDMKEAVAAPANMTFHFEELDGTATAIKSINADNLNGKIAEGMYNMNGMKMNSVPTQKGVYIVNGKKVVIK